MHVLKHTSCASSIADFLKIRSEKAGYVCCMHPERQMTTHCTLWAPRDGQRRRGTPRLRWRDDSDAFGSHLQDQATDFCPVVGHKQRLNKKKSNTILLANMMNNIVRRTGDAGITKIDSLNPLVFDCGLLIEPHTYPVFDVIVRSGCLLLSRFLIGLLLGTTQIIRPIIRYSTICNTKKSLLLHACYQIG